MDDRAGQRRDRQTRMPLERNDEPPGEIEIPDQRRGRHKDKCQHAEINGDRFSQQGIIGELVNHVLKNILLKRHSDTNTSTKLGLFPSYKLQKLISFCFHYCL